MNDVGEVRKMKNIINIEKIEKLYDDNGIRWFYENHWMFDILELPYNIHSLLRQKLLLTFLDR